MTSKPDALRHIEQLAKRFPDLEASFLHGGDSLRYTQARQRVDAAMKTYEVGNIVRAGCDPAVIRSLTLYGAILSLSPSVVAANSWARFTGLPDVTRRDRIRHAARRALRRERKPPIFSPALALSKPPEPGKAENPLAMRAPDGRAWTFGREDVPRIEVEATRMPLMLVNNPAATAWYLLAEYVEAVTRTPHWLGLADLLSAATGQNCNYDDTRKLIKRARQAHAKWVSGRPSES